MRISSLPLVALKTAVPPTPVDKAVKWLADQFVGATPAPNPPGLGDPDHLPPPVKDDGPGVPPPPSTPGLAKRLYRYARTGVGLFGSVEFKPTLVVHPEADPMTATGEMGVSRPTRGNITQLLVDGNDFKRAMLDKINHATQSIWLNYYLFDLGKDTADIEAAIVAAKKRGVRVRLIVDNRDSARDYVDPSTDLGDSVNRLRAAGVEVVRSPTNNLGINHRKIAVIDGQQAIVSGYNFTDNYLRGAPSATTYHDSGVLLCGPAVLDVAAVFADSWQEATHDDLPLPPRLSPMRGAAPDEQIQVVTHDKQRDRNIERELLQRIGSAKDHILFANGNPMTASIEEALVSAMNRGVKITWITGAQLTDSEGVGAERSIANLIAANNAKKLDDLEAEYFEGVKPSSGSISVYQYPTLLHAKVYSFDGSYTIMGSSNLDGFSTWQDDEVALQIKGASFAKQIESRIFSVDIPKSKLLDQAPPHDDSIKNRVMRKAEPELDAAAVVFAAR